MAHAASRRLPRLLSVSTFAEETLIPLSTVYLLINRGDLKAVRFGEGRGSSVRIHEDDAHAWIEEHRGVAP